MITLLKNIFARIWAIWGLVTFILTFLIIIGPSMLSHVYKNEKKGQDFFIAVSRYWIRFWLFLIACPLKINGLQHFKNGESYVVVYNHNAFLDVPLSAAFIPSGNKTIAKDSFAKVPIFAWFYKRGGVMVNRADERSRTKSFEQMKKVLQKGMHMCLYPEGTRNRTEAPLKPFYDGAFKLAVDTHTQVLPGIILGTKKAMPIHKKLYLLPTKLSIHFLPPVNSNNISVKELNTKVHELMEAEFVKYS